MSIHGSGLGMCLSIVCGAYGTMQAMGRRFFFKQGVVLISDVWGERICAVTYMFSLDGL